MREFLLDKRLFKFFVVGGVNTLFSYLIFAGLIYLEIHFSLAILIAQVLGVLFNFQTTGRLVFQSKDQTLLFRFILVYFITYGLNVGFVKLLSLAGVNFYYSGALVALPLAVISFFLMKLFVFVKKSDEEL